VKISFQWLKQFVDPPVEARRLADDLSMVGLTVESIEALDDDFIIELDLTANRGDCLSHWGVAREVAALYGVPLHPPRISLSETDTDVSKAASVEIADSDLCYRYCARVVTGVKVGPSPSWLVKQLEAVGQRPINNIADVTNYVLFELGHPLHAFDLDRLAQHKIIVRRAKKGEHLTTLDGVDRALSADHLMIADAVKPVALAGVMGGAESEISPLTKNVLIESAWFLPTSIRSTARTFGMHTEASHRFERGTDIENAVMAMNRCAQLIQDVAAGSIQKGFIDCYPTAITPRDILLRQAQLKRHLGIEIPPEGVERILKSLHFEPVLTKAEGKVWRTPTWRNDVTREIDLMEEIARHYGYEKFPPRLLRSSTRGSNLPSAKPISCLREALRASGYYEIVSFPFLDRDEAAKYTDLAAVELANPLSEVAGALRPTALPSLLEMIRRNLNRGQRDLRLYEIGKTYFREDGGKPTERAVLVMGATGEFRPKVLHETHPQRYDFFTFKADVEQVLDVFETVDAQFFKSGNRFHIYQQDQSSDVVLGGRCAATFGLLDSSVLDRYKIKQPIFAAEVDLELLLQRGLRRIQFKPVSPFPAVERDLSFILPEGKTYKDILDTIMDPRLENLVQIMPFDQYSIDSFGKGRQSLSIHLTFQSDQRTLTEEEVNKQLEIVMTLLMSVGAVIRKQP